MYKTLLHNFFFILLNFPYCYDEDSTKINKCDMLTLVEKLSFMTILCHFGCVIPNIRVNLDASFQTFMSIWMHHSKHSCHIGPFSYHIRHFLSFWTVSQKTMFSTSVSGSY